MQAEAPVKTEKCIRAGLQQEPEALFYTAIPPLQKKGFPCVGFMKVKAIYWNGLRNACLTIRQSMRRTLRHALQLGVFLLLAFNLLPFSAQTLSTFTEQYFNAAVRKHGPDAKTRLQAWERLMADGKALPEQEKLRAVNDFWNRIPYKSDQEHWGVHDYWATPAEMVASNGGDCEDFSIGKYFTLVAMGVDKNKLKITYVIADIGAHMVLAYYETPGSTPLILDNLVPIIRPADRRSDLRPVYSFNGDGMWLIKGGAESRVGTPSNIRFWRQLLARMGNEFK